MDYVLISDVARWYAVLLSTWLSALLLTLTYRRLREYGFKHQPMPHPLATIGVSVVLIGAIVVRFERLGQPGDLDLWFIVVGVTLAVAGVVRHVRFTLKPPWRRHPTPR